MRRREDGRGLEECRKPLICTKVVAQALGSSYVELGTTKIVCSVYGPKPNLDEFKQEGEIVYNYRRAPFALANRGKTGDQDNTVLDEKLAAEALDQALSLSVAIGKFPKSSFTVNVLVLESGPGELPLAIMAASVACCDGGIELYDMMSACTVCSVLGELIVDPTAEELQLSTFQLMLAYMTNRKEVAYLQSTGESTTTELKQAIQLGTHACGKCTEVIEECLTKSWQAEQ
eukprot:TRINITY_DN67004_c4_g1_i1.p2 TRINITY_DN67004_c4_g1~~TRINITY_DN67004_c4_g1_i1.p2  ORF type:complete len:231 (+),score=7.12 TRINITY_DN67004_c4_g1_i1:30-722(+)